MSNNKYKCSQDKCVKVIFLFKLLEYKEITVITVDQYLWGSKTFQGEQNEQSMLKKYNNISRRQQVGLDNKT